MPEKIRWGIIGLGSIAHHFVKDLALVHDAELIAVASRSRQKAEDFAIEYKAAYAFGSYEELFRCKEVEVVYIATPHTLHAENSIEAMNHGKHVLCEKPLGVNTAEVCRIIAVTRKNKVFLMEALWSRFNPTIQQVVQLIQDDVIGDISYLHADFAFPALHRDKNNRLLNANLAGGTLLDIGIYPIFLSYLLLGIPQTIYAASKMFATGVEWQTSMLFDYHQAQAILYSGFNSKSKMEAEISGTKGAVFIDPRWHEAQGYSLELNGKKTHVDLPTTGRGYFYEIMEVHHCLKTNQLESLLWTHKNSKDLIGIIDAVGAQAGVIFPFEK